MEKVDPVPADVPLIFQSYVGRPPSNVADDVKLNTSPAQMVVPAEALMLNVGVP